jgi:uncharacterized protein (TIGR04562 family)
LSRHIWNIPWQEFEVALGLKNSFLQRNLNINSHFRSQVFLKNCGFDIQDKTQEKQFEQLLGEALFFIRHVLFTDEERALLFVPHEILHLDNPKTLLMMASSLLPRKRYKRLWACSLLKVMYSIANIQFSGKLQLLDNAREQIFKKIRGLISSEPDQKIEFESLSLPLVKVEWKEAKTRTSILLKLLHKPDSIVDEVFDYLGVRFVVKTTNEIPLLLKLLIESDIIIPHQVVSVRTRNSILNVKNPKKILTFLDDLYSNGTLTDTQVEEMSSKVNWQPQPGEELQKKMNIFSSQHYRSLQFTVRHLVRTANPAYLALESLSNQLRRYTGMQRQEPWMESVIPEQFANYFPIEIQIMDLESYELAKFGPASHEQYKSNQWKSVRDRVLGNLIRFDEEKQCSQD